MIDTVILTIPNTQVYQNQPGYTPTTWDLNSRTAHYEKYVRNPSAVLVREDVYLPRLTYIKRKGQQAFLKIEFSVPKILYGNNLDEVTEENLSTIIEILKMRLALMNVGVDTDTLKNAPVSAFHASKNIKLGSGYTASFAASELSKINLNQKFDLDKTKFRNNGSSLQGWTQSHSLVFYDKIADMAKKGKNAIDRDQTPQQLSLFASIKSDDKKLEVLRMEVRLSKKQKMNSVLSRLGLKEGPTFEDVVKNNVCQKIVAFYWETLIKAENLFLFELGNTPKKILKEILRRKKKMSAKEAIFLVGLKLLCQDEGGIRDLRDTLKHRISQRNWYRFSDGIKFLNRGSKRKAHHNWVSQIDEAIKAFTPFKFSTGPPAKD